MDNKIAPFFLLNLFLYIILSYICYNSKFNVNLKLICLITDILDRNPIVPTRIVRHKPDDGPADPRNKHRIPHRRVNQVVLGHIPLRVIVADALREHEHVVPVQMHRVGVALHHRRALEHDVHHGAMAEAPRQATPRRRLQPPFLGSPLLELG